MSSESAYCIGVVIQLLNLDVFCVSVS